MSKHTPGPWEPTNSDDLDDPPGNVVCTLGDGWYVSSEHEPTRDSNEADARLIAAAPEMLDALEAAAHVLPLGEEYNAVVEAIAKAKGEAE